TLKVNTHHDAAGQGSGAHEYDRGATDHDALLDLMARVGPDGMRIVVSSDLAAALDRGLEVRDPDLPLGGGPRQAFELRLRDPASFERYRSTGIDEFEDIATALGMVRGQVLRDALVRRTGEQFS